LQEDFETSEDGGAAGDGVDVALGYEGYDTELFAAVGTPLLS